MELQFEKRAFRFLSPVLREIREQEQTQELRLSDGMPDIGHVICAWGQVILRGKEWLGDSLSLNGGVMLRVLYAPEDGTESRCMEEWMPFRMKWELPDGVREGDMRVNCLLRSVDGRHTSPRKIMVRCGLAARMEAFSPEEAEVYRPGQTEQNLQLLWRTYPLRLPKEAGEKTFLLDEELNLPASAPKPVELIYCMLRPEATEQRVAANRVVFRGNGNLHMLYRAEGGQLHTWDFELPFSQLAQLQGDCSGEARADVIMGVTGLEPELGGDGQIHVKCGLVGQYVVDDREMLEVVEDAYCPGRGLSVETGELRVPGILENRTENIHMEQSVPMDVHVMTDVICLPDFPRSRKSGDGVELELPGVFRMLGYGEGGQLQSGTARWENCVQIPADDAVGLNPEFCLRGNPDAAVGEGNVTVTCGAVLKLESTTQRGIPMVTGLEVGENRDPDPGRPSLILRRAGEEELWNLAKRYGSTVDAIRKANGLEEVPSADRLLMIPVP